LPPVAHERVLTTTYEKSSAIFRRVSVVTWKDTPILGRIPCAAGIIRNVQGILREFSAHLEASLLPPPYLS
jgi:hypothetical protein